MPRKRVSPEMKTAIQVDLLARKREANSALRAYHQALQAANDRGISTQELSVMTGEARSSIGRWIRGVP